MEVVAEKLDLRKTDPSYYLAGKEPEIRDLDSYNYLTVAGKCSPKSEEFLEAIELLYAVAYSIKFTCKTEDYDFVVPKMEGFWWIDGSFEAQKEFTNTPENEWNWKIMIRMPDFVEQEHHERAIQRLLIKNPHSLVSKVKWELINEGRCVQVMHVGSYSDEEHSVAKIMDYIQENGLQICGYHHEIYLSDPRRTSEEKLRTILRYAVKNQ